MSNDAELIDRNILKLAPGGMRAIMAGEQGSTTRLGLRRYTLGHALLVDGHQELRISITLLEAIEFGKLTFRHAAHEGCESHITLMAKIRRFYPGVRRFDVLTHIRFALVDQEPIEVYRGGRRGRRFGGIGS